MDESETTVLLSQCFSETFSQSFDQFDAWSRDALVEDPDNPIARFVQARCYMEKGDFAAATEAYLDVLNRGVVPPRVAGMVAQNVATNHDPRIAADIVEKHCLAKGFFAPSHDVFDAALLRNGKVRELAAYYSYAIDNGKFPSPEGLRMKEQGMRRGLPMIFLNTLPKSGSVFLYFNVSGVLGLPRMRISVNRFPRDVIIERALELAASGGCVTQEHLDASAENLRLLEKYGVDRVYLHVRDPRQAALSQFHDYEKPSVRARIMQPLEFQAMSSAERLDQTAHVFVPQCVDWLRDWLDVCDGDGPFDVLVGEYAGFRKDNTGAIKRVLEHFNAAEQANWSRLISKEKGKMHFRKADPDEWRKVYSKEQQAAMWKVIPEAMAERFGWSE